MKAEISTRTKITVECIKNDRKGHHHHFTQKIFSHQKNVSIFPNFPVVSQEYITEAHNVHVIIGNVALVKCEIPSFVADFVSVVSWTDGHGNEFFLNDRSLGKNHFQKSWVTQANCLEI